jgi:Spy/CpxP family protein refolding chaperone
MKKTIVSVLLIYSMLSVLTTIAQDRLGELMNDTTPEERAQMQTNNMKETLSLTEDQVDKVSEINLNYARKMQNAYNAGGSKLQKLRKMKTLAAEKDGVLKKVLTPTQYATYQEGKEEMKERRRERKG